MGWEELTKSELRRSAVEELFSFGLLLRKYFEKCGRTNTTTRGQKMMFTAQAYWETQSRAYDKGRYQISNADA